MAEWNQGAGHEPGEGLPEPSLGWVEPGARTDVKKVLGEGFRKEAKETQGKGRNRGETNKKDQIKIKCHFRNFGRFLWALSIRRLGPTSSPILDQLERRSTENGFEKSGFHIG